MSRRLALSFALALIAVCPAAAQQSVPAPQPVNPTVPAPVPLPMPAPAPQMQEVQIATSHAEAARELLQVTGAVQPFQQLLPNVMRQVAVGITQSNLTIQSDAPRRAAFEASVRAVEEALRAEQDQLLAGMALLYAARFTEPELRQLVTFFRSPVGQKYVTTTPMIAQESMRSAEAWAQRTFQAAFTQIREEMRRRGHPLN